MRQNISDDILISGWNPHPSNLVGDLGSHEVPLHCSSNENIELVISKKYIVFQTITLGINMNILFWVQNWRFDAIYSFQAFSLDLISSLPSFVMYWSFFHQSFANIVWYLLMKFLKYNAKQTSIDLHFLVGDTVRHTSGSW